MLDELERTIARIEKARDAGANTVENLVSLDDLRALPALLRVARAAQWLHDAERNARATNAAIDAYDAAQVAQELYDARGEFIAALAALEAANA